METRAKLPKSALAFFREVGRMGGLAGGVKGGKATAKRMTKAERIARSRKGAAASAKARRAKVKARTKGGKAN